MEKKITKRDYFNELKGLVANRQDLVEFINHELELLDKKASSRTQSKNQVENENIKLEIVNALSEIAKPVTISELQESNSTMATYSNQKLSALLKQLVENDKKVVKTTDKKKSYFTVA